MCDYHSYQPPRSAKELLEEAEARKKKREEKKREEKKHSTGTDFQEDHIR